MKTIPRQHGQITLSEGDVREIQLRTLSGQLTEDDRLTLDAILSYFIINEVNPIRIENSKPQGYASYIGRFQLPQPPSLKTIVAV